MKGYELRIWRLLVRLAKWSLIGVTFLFWFYSVMILPVTKTLYDDPVQIHLPQLIQKWGDRPFDPRVFKDADPEVRASMVADLIRSRRYLGKSFSIAENELGIQDPPGKKRSLYFALNRPGTWLKSFEYSLVISRDPDTGLVDYVIVSRYCCKNNYVTVLHGRGWIKIDGDEYKGRSLFSDERR